MRAAMVLSLAVLAVFGLGSSEARAQSTAAAYIGGAGAERSVEYFVSRHRLNQENGERPDLDGVGGRVLWSLAPLATRLGAPLLTHASVGGYLVSTAAQLERGEMWHYGIETDVRVTTTPLAGRVEPLVTLAAGAVHIDEPARRMMLAPGAMAGERVPDAPRMPAVVPDLELTLLSPAQAGISLAPGVGARVRVLDGLNVRTDVRPVIDGRSEGRRFLELSGGISLVM